ncbi:MAG TPA: polysaccharide biosynthesis/export family protein [Prolixibacteraceae bacterium]|nr:polysaccharide biosynthesis/export family protein [Prolixibacteraceae bacterium]
MKKGIFKLFFVPFVAGVVMSACTPLKDIVYFPEAQSDLTPEEIPVPDDYRIQPFDNLYIQVISNDELSMYFNISSTDRYLNNDAAIELGSYKVNKNGEIDFPYIGTIHVSGMTTDEIKHKIDEGISKHLVQYSVIVKHVNRHFTLLGEFQSPGTYTFYKDNITIFEAIGYGRDLTDYGNRHNVKIIRHTQEGKRIATFDLTENDILSSNFYYILPNDVIYVEPSTKIWGTKTLPFTAILTTINTAVLLYNAINNALK